LEASPAALLSREGLGHQMGCRTSSIMCATRSLPGSSRLQSPDLELWAAGASIGAFHSVAVVCRFPDVFARACDIGDLRSPAVLRHHRVTDEFWVSRRCTSSHAVRHLELLRPA
jgi:hypothetical protein